MRDDPCGDPMPDLDPGGEGDLTPDGYPFRKRVSRFLGWLWLPVPWIWRGCFDGEAARECVRRGWLELTGKVGPYRAGIARKPLDTKEVTAYNETTRAGD